ncbi:MULTISPECIES: molybdenum cofactor guanylyltransferase MobA [unclassified Ensifer]|uniref:molybdenum cofactor guanylyltransferase MobA n=1 Tax=unclassified Ensifer TaxID=2633371 RepID=UPI0008134892|nr:MULTISPECIES: molybdenum cofactor guanylyltransferase MobA [unclassified Ensifer]OCP18879.1 molybdenum cofactor guanylyltransferase MobA [Ensifer sp. LC384]OCP27917.1 molybdenum cofactor guanylyltransferase MobA [Ensifer sp. LC54]OCP36270.1 molybdenum cofactor guanylyltransferase MobA [Ensifer sp. LC163]
MPTVKTSDARHPLWPAVVLAGGLSRRMGRPKSDLLLDGKTMLWRIVERLQPQVASVAINLNGAGERAAIEGHPVICDTVPGFLGPLAGVLTAMRHAAAATPTATHVLVVPTDTPFFPHDLAQRLTDAMTGREQIAVASSDGALHPLFALWSVGLADDLEHWLTTDPKRRVRTFIERHPSVTVDFPMTTTTSGLFDPFFNINTPDDLLRAEEWLGILGENSA